MLLENGLIPPLLMNPREDVVALADGFGGAYDVFAFPAKVAMDPLPTTLP